MATCIFFGHKNCYGLSREKLHETIERLILQGADIFYVGNQGLFDQIVCASLSTLQTKHPHIHFSIVLAYLPESAQETEGLTNTIYPEIEIGPPRFAISRRNRWMIGQADYCICYVTHRWGGAYQFAALAKKRGVEVINLAVTDIF